MDAVAQSMLDVFLVSQQTTSHHALNIVHPRPISWDSIFINIADALENQGVVDHEIPLVTFSEWLQLLENASDDEIHLENLVR